MTEIVFLYRLLYRTKTDMDIGIVYVENKGATVTMGDRPNTETVLCVIQ